MLSLVFVSLLWAFSFGLIKGRLAGLDPVAVSVLRLAFATMVFLPFLRPRALPRRDIIGLAFIGAIQFGVMYALYTAAYGYLKAHEVALATILTPVYVALIDAAVENRTRWRHMVAASLAVLGAGVLIWQNRTSDTIVTGFLIVQGANLCFAAGQVAYKRIRPTLPKNVSDAGIFFWPCLGATAITLVISAFHTDWLAFRPSASQWGVLAYLGILASGLGFFLWNYGATRVNTGTLAAFNNAKVPLGVVCSLVIFHETTASLTRLAISLGLLVTAVLVAEWKPVATKKAGR
ncbi:MAG: EamA family transporter [Opitutaceae bacterium]|jgi:drug/metabolite transporter (DMT)-like permease